MATGNFRLLFSMNFGALATNDTFAVDAHKSHEAKFASDLCVILTMNTSAPTSGTYW
jgi:hypothetical protein